MGRWVGWCVGVINRQVPSSMASHRPNGSPCSALAVPSPLPFDPMPFCPLQFDLLPFSPLYSPRRPIGIPLGTEGPVVSQTLVGGGGCKILRTYGDDLGWWVMVIS